MATQERSKSVEWLDPADSNGSIYMNKLYIYILLDPWGALVNLILGLKSLFSLMCLYSPNPFSGLYPTPQCLRLVSIRRPLYLPSPPILECNGPVGYSSTPSPLVVFPFHKYPLKVTQIAQCLKVACLFHFQVLEEDLPFGPDMHLVLRDEKRLYPACS
jgi:hypothetical protein